MPQKHYYLFGIRIWSVVVTADEVEEVEETDEAEADGTNTSLDSYITPPMEARPMFGFTPWTPEPWGDYED